MRLHVTALGLLVAMCLALAPQAHAHLVRPFRGDNEQRLAVAKKNILHVDYACDRGSKQVKATHCPAVSWLRKVIQRRSPSPQPSTQVPSWIYNAFMCIHRYEGAWDDAWDPFWGGLQMDRDFMYSYGAWAIREYGGFANVWPPAVQISVAYTAYRSGRGFNPWPNTARYCGLL